MSLTSKTQIIGVQYESGNTNVKVAYTDSSRFKRTVVTADNSIVAEWVADGGSIKAYVAPHTVEFQTPNVRN